MDGFLLVNKPPGPTSHDVVEEIRFFAGGERVGHAGTLDPFAEGLLIVLIGSYTKRSAEFMGLSKIYRAVLRFGVRSNTHDIEGELVPAKEVVIPQREDIESALEKFRGEIMQVPPQFSAVKVKGRKAYEEARAGRAVPLEARKVVISELTAVWYSYPILTLDAGVSSGTYIRSLARDIGEALGVGAVLSALRREAIGKYKLQDAADFTYLTSQNWERFVIQ